MTTKFKKTPTYINGTSGRPDYVAVAHNGTIGLAIKFDTLIPGGRMGVPGGHYFAFRVRAADVSEHLQDAGNVVGIKPPNLDTAFPKVKWQVQRGSSRSAITGIMLTADGVADLLKAIETANIPGQLQAHIAELAGEHVYHVQPSVVIAELEKMVEKVASKLRSQLKDAETVATARKDKIGAFAQEGEFLEMLAKQHQDGEVEDADDTAD